MVDPGPGAAAFEDKLAYFQAITGLDDPDLCTEILSAHDWDLELAISSFTDASAAPSGAAGASRAAVHDPGPSTGGIGGGPPPQQDLVPAQAPASPGLAWKLITLPFYVVSGGVGLISGAVGLGVWIAGGVVSRSLGLLGLLPPRRPEDSPSSLIPPLSAAAAEAAEFVAAFEREFGGTGVLMPNFVAEGFMDALQRSTREFKLLFVYLHSPDHPDVPGFCSDCLCSDVVAEFVNANFVSWGGSIRGSEGFKMSNSLKASRFPFCAVVMPATNQRIALLQQDIREVAITKADLCDCRLKVLDMGAGTGYHSLSIVKHVEAKNMTIWDQSTH
ncbi:hypothetical protein Taro_035780 [Colocasia esculenta]|uniref:UAS domain-containing protein n=1 Tax=Colocasia esculenta TaxID=4460 RepID=A0A843W6N0_COLES|nr:hypothetical protein [Colocasia esculenta]